MTHPPYDEPLFYDLRTAHRVEDLRLFVREAARFGEPVLELGCGTGRVALHLAQRGFRVVGIDLDAAMLARAREKARAAAVPLPLVRGDMTRLGFGPAFRLACIPFAAVHDLPDVRDWERCFRSARAALAPGGALVLDDHAPPLPGDTDGPQNFLVRDEAAGVMIHGRQTIRVDPASRTTRGEIAYRWSRPDGTMEERRFPFRGTWAERPEVEGMLVRAGFRRIEVLGDYAGDPWRPGSPRMIYRAT